MIKIENVEVFGWEAAIRGMRNPMNSWEKGDSEWVLDLDSGRSGITLAVGANDLKLMKNLRNTGSDHGKFMRMINVTLDITAPLYWWKEFDTYKVGTVANSCSTMHKIQAKEFELSDFSHEHLDRFGVNTLNIIIKNLNYNRRAFNDTKDKLYWWNMIQLLPSSYNQRRTVQLNYEVLRHMFFARRAHKLDEWIYFCEWITEIPYAKELICCE